MGIENFMLPNRGMENLLKKKLLYNFLITLQDWYLGYLLHTLLVCKTQFLQKIFIPGVVFKKCLRGLFIK